MFTAILCPVDFSAPSRQALRHAVAISRRTNGRVTALYANDPLLTAAAVSAFGGRPLPQSSADELKAFVKETVGPDQAARVTIRTEVGQPVRVIRKAARRLRANLIVVGSKGLSGAGRLFLGSITAQLLRETTVPVLAIPPSSGRKVAAAWPGRRVLAAIDLGAGRSSDARAFASVARAFDLPMTLAHVVEPGQLPPWLSGYAKQESQARADKAAATLERLAGRFRPDVRVDTRVLVGDPSKHIPVLARKIGAGLIVLALRQADGMFGAAQGTITYRVLASGGAVPILALPGRGRARASSAASNLDLSAFT
jgi:nucleotide-binding universal stress UspA family protein